MSSAVTYEEFQVFCCILSDHEQVAGRNAISATARVQQDNIELRRQRQQLLVAVVVVLQHKYNRTAQSDNKTSLETLELTRAWDHLQSQVSQRH